MRRINPHTSNGYYILPSAPDCKGKAGVELWLSTMLPSHTSMTNHSLSHTTTSGSYTETLGVSSPDWRHPTFDSHF